jgi:hypothetical protein
VNVGTSASDAVAAITAAAITSVFVFIISALYKLR